MSLSTAEITLSANRLSELNKSGKRFEANQYLIELGKYQPASTVSAIAKIAGLLFITPPKALKQPSNRSNPRATL